MQVSKWGNSLAIRIPVDVARALGLKVGDEVELRAVDDHRAELARRLSPEELVVRMKAVGLRLPADGSWKLTREEMNGADRLL